MDAIKIYVNKQMDGYVFTIMPAMRELIKGWYPDCRPANKIFVSYNIKSGFEISYGKLEKVISPALLSFENISKLNGKVNEIQFLETQTGKLLHAYPVRACRKISSLLRQSRTFDRNVRISDAWMECGYSRG